MKWLLALPGDRGRLENDSLGRRCGVGKERVTVPGTGHPGGKSKASSNGHSPRENAWVVAKGQLRVAGSGE